MKKTVLLTIAILAVAISYLGGYFFGFQGGAKNYVALDNTVRGVLGYGKINLYEKSGFEPLRHAFELEVDTGIDSYMDYEDSNFLDKKLSEHYFQPLVERREDYISRIVEWRKTHPLVMNCEWVEHLKTNQEYGHLYVEEKNSCNEYVAKLETFLTERGALTGGSSAATPPRDAASGAP